MWTAVFDAAGHERDQDYLVIAGFIARTQDWLEFESEWLTRLQRDGLNHYHHSEHSRRQNLLNVLVGIIQRHVAQKVACCVPKSSLAVLPKVLRDNFRLTAYSLAGRTAVGQVREWLLYRRTPDAPTD